MQKQYKRILLKISGEAFKGPKDIHDIAFIDNFCKEIKPIYKKGTELAVVVGGGNICRGRNYTDHAIPRAVADYIGMLATVINGLALKEILEKNGMKARVFSMIPMESICDTYCLSRAKEALLNKEVVIFTGGTGNPFVSTDTASVVKSIEMDCDLLLKCTNVDGVFSSDPAKDKSATKYDVLTYAQVVKEKLEVMDQSAIHIAMEHKLPIAVFSIYKKGGLASVLEGKGNYTIIS